MSANSANKITDIKLVDLFCGVGGIRYGIEQKSILDDISQTRDRKNVPSFSCVFSSDIDAECRRIYQMNFGEFPKGDITLINGEEVPNHDILCAGFPCQPFSVAGRQRGFEDTRGTLFFDIARIIEVRRPKILFLENVKNLVHHDSGNTLNTILTVLKDFGYSVSYEVLNAKDFGIPQNRERLIIIGIKDKNSTFDFSKVKRKELTSIKEFFESIEKHISEDTDNDEYTFLDETEYTLLTSTVQNKQSGLIFSGYRNKPGRKSKDGEYPKESSRAHRQYNRIYSIYGTHPTLSAQEKNGRYFILDENNKVRKLTLEECWHLMGFPLDFRSDSSASIQYHQLGNSVCIPMIEAVAEEVLKIM